MADYKVPGVYVEEPFGLSMSIQHGETAVPVIVFDKADSLAVLMKIVDEALSVESWLDITSAITNASKKEADVEGNLYRSLQLYFLNGGGHCYVCDVDKFAALVPSLDDVTLLVQAGAKSAAFSQAVNTLSAGQVNYFALADASNTELKDRLGVTTAAAALTFTSAEKVAAYYPSLKVGTTPVPSSAAVAGAYARVDRERGVWKSPANVEIVGATPQFKVTDEVSQECNVPAAGGKSINVIRTFRGTGTLIWGARTLASKTDAWRYVAVRRLFNAVERDIRQAMSVVLFEPNSAQTWERVRSAAENYVHALWKQGALLGTTPDEAYFVHIGRGITMTDDDIKQGKMILKIGLAAVRPAEFVVLQLTQDVLHG